VECEQVFAATSWQVFTINNPKISTWYRENLIYVFVAILGYKYFDIIQ